MIALKVRHDEKGFILAIIPETGEIVFGGEFNAGGVNGLDASAVIQAAINYADLIDAPLFQTNRNKETRGKE
jgi:hypothetical protein